MTTRKYTTLVFDCDGTLLDTLTDLANAVQHVLATHHLPPQSLDDIRKNLGNGLEYLLRHSVPEDTTEEDLALYRETFTSYYTEHLQDFTAPYEGILHMLDIVKEEGYKLAIVSNKVQEGVTPLNAQYFRDRIPVAIGERAGIPRKPSPHMVWLALEELDSTKEESIYIGDSEVDVATAENSGLLCIAVTWGFRDESLHHELGVTHIARTPEDIIHILHQLNGDMGKE